MTGAGHAPRTAVGGADIDWPLPAAAATDLPTGLVAAITGTTLCLARRVEVAQLLGSPATPATAGAHSSAGAIFAGLGRAGSAARRRLGRCPAAEAGRCVDLAT